MKKTELKQLIREEISKIIKESPAWIDSKSPKAKILTNVFYIGENAEDDLRPFRGSAVPSYDLQGYTWDYIKNKGDGMLYIKKGEEGWYDENEGTFESKNENSTTSIKKEYIKLIS